MSGSDSSTPLSETSNNVSPIRIGEKKKVLQHREQRVELPAEVDARAKIVNFYGNEISLEVSNLSKYGAKLICHDNDEWLATNKEIPEASIFVNAIKVYSGPIAIVNELQGANDRIQYGIVLRGGSIDIDQVRAIIGYAGNGHILLETKKIIQTADLVRPEFKILVSDLNTILQDLRYKLLMEEQKIKSTASSENHKNRLEEHAITIATSLYSPSIHKIFNDFHSLVQEFSSEETLLHKRYFRANFHPIALGAPFIARAFEKPLGYAGDFGLMLMFYDYKDIGATLFDRWFHRFSCNEPAAVANKNRVEFLSDELSQMYHDHSQEKFRVSSIACGPAKEIELFLKNSKADKSTIEVVCIDQEPQALDAARDRIRAIANSKKNIKSSFLCEDAVLGIIRGHQFTKSIEMSNVIVSAGLFDYLSDRVAKKLISSFVELLDEGGVIYIGNVSKRNPDVFSMSYFMEWSLVLRDEEELAQLVESNLVEKYNLTYEVVSESLGLNLFLKIKKNKK